MNVVAAIALIASLVACGSGMRRIVRVLAPTLPAYGPSVVAIGASLAGFIAIVSLVGRAARSFDAALIGAAVAGLVVYFIARRFELRTAVVDVPTSAERNWFIAALIGVGALYAWVATKYQMHDEHSIFGHKSMVEQLRRGEYPIYLPPIPDQDARYHYGFDLLAGALARAFDLSTDASIDIVTVGLALLISCAAAAVVSDAGAKRAAPFAAVAIHLGAGLAWLMLAGVDDRHPRCLVQYHHPSCGVELFPTPFLNVFQHPVSIGVPLLLLAIVLARRVLDASRIAHAVLLAVVMVVVMVGLSVGQVVYFALGGLAIVAAVPLWLAHERRWSDRNSYARVGLVVAALVVAFGLAWLAGGMFTPSPVTDPNLIVRRPNLGFPPNEPMQEILRHHAINLGIGFVLLPVLAGWVVVRRRFTAAALFAFAAGGMMVPHIWNYVRSWDIVKFPSASAFALTLLYVVVIDAPLIGRMGALAWVRRAGRALLLGSGILAATWVSVPLPSQWLLYSPQRFVNDDQVQRTVDWFLARDYRRHELIYVQSNIAQYLAVFGGLSVVGADSDFIYLGVRSEILAEQRALNAKIRRTMDPAALEALGIHWVMLSTEEQAGLGPAAKKALDDRARFELVATFEAPEARRTRRIWRVLRPPKL